jgi:hypothetical protein
MVSECIDEMYAHALNLVRDSDTDPEVKRIVNKMMDLATNPKLSRSFAIAAVRVAQSAPRPTGSTNGSKLYTLVQKLSESRQHDFFSVVNSAIFVSATSDLTLGWLTRPVIMSSLLEFRGNKVEIRDSGATYLTPNYSDRFLVAA